MSVSLPALAANPHNAPRVDLVRDISFGTIALGSQGGQVTVGSNDSLTCSGGLRCLGGQNAGVFTITGAKDELVSICIPPTTLSDGKGHNLAASFTSSNTTMVLRPGNAKNRFTVGGTLTTGNGLVEGSYSGTFDVIVDYE